MKTLRSWRVPLLVALTLFFAVPLWQLSSHDAYEPAKQFIYDHVPNYFKQDHGVYNNTLYKDANNINVHAQYNFSNPCDGFPNTDRIMLVMKTGATESLVKMPTQLLTTMQCLPDFLIFSDKVLTPKTHTYILTVLTPNRSSRSANITSIMSSTASTTP